MDKMLLTAYCQKSKNLNFDTSKCFCYNTGLLPDTFSKFCFDWWMASEWTCHVFLI